MKIINQILKVFLAGFTAVIILSVVLLPYSLQPVHIPNDLKNTDYVWPPNSHWIRNTEGFSFGKFDENGFNNIEVINNPDIVIVGSSHMEATNVLQQQNLGYLLNQKLNDRYTVYNMGISGHTLYKVCQYLPNTLELYDNPPKVVIIETSDVILTSNKVNQVIEKTVEFTPSHNTGIIAHMQKIPFVRLAYHQLDGGLLDLFMPNNENSSDKTLAKKEEIVDLDAYKTLFEYLKSLKDEYNSEIIIFYHPFETLNDDGTIQFENSEYLDTFSLFAQEYNITFVDMTKSFEKMYYEEHYVPHGFSTGKIASGHLNAYGHEAISASLIEVINKLEGDGKICK